MNKKTVVPKKRQITLYLNEFILPRIDEYQKRGFQIHIDMEKVCIKLVYKEKIFIVDVLYDNEWYWKIGLHGHIYCLMNMEDDACLSDVISTLEDYCKE